jgi:hypothetical protein
VRLDVSVKLGGKDFSILPWLSQVVNFIILNSFKVVKLKSCFILLRGILVTVKGAGYPDLQS